MNERPQITLVILAAGMSSRFGRLKQLEPVGPNDETLLEFNIYDAIKAGIQKVILVIRKEIEEPMKSYYSSPKLRHLGIEYVIQNQVENRAKPYGTGHAILSAKKFVSGNFVVINADDYYGLSAFLSATKYFIETNNSTNYGMVPYVLHETLSENGSVNRGICKVDNKSTLLAIEEHTNIQNDEIGPFTLLSTLGKKREDKNALVSMNLWALNSSIFPKLEVSFEDFLSNSNGNYSNEFQFPTVINQLIEKKEIEVKVLPEGKDWFGFTYPEDKQIVQLKLKAKAELGEYPIPLFKS